jgi:enolase
MSEHQISRTPQHTSSPGLAPSDFYLFSAVNDRLERIHTVDGDDLFEQSLEILQKIPIDELDRVFTAWIDRVHKVSKQNGDYIAS